MVVHTLNPSTLEVEAGIIMWVWDFLKKKKKTERETKTKKSHASQIIFVLSMIIIAYYLKTLIITNEKIS